MQIVSVSGELKAHFVPPHSNFFSTAAPRQADQPLRTQIVLLEEADWTGEKID